MIKKKNIIILIVVLTFIVGTVTFISYQYLFRENKSKDSKVEINNQINIDKDNQEDNKSEEIIIDEEKIENNNNQEITVENNNSSSEEKVNVTPKPSSTPKPTSSPTTTPKPSSTPTPSQTPGSNSSANNETVENSSNENNNQKQESENNGQSDLDFAIQYQLEAGDPITYNENGKMITVDECMRMGDLLVNKQDTTHIYQYECPFTKYGNATAVGLFVCFKNNGLQQCSSYDEYKTIMK
ncbi:hypothetical protein EGW03_02645 [bacterium]|nr:hypothetical protein [bacterium]